MASKHLCTSCYLKGKEDYMLPVQAFGIKQRQDYYPIYVNQGAWTRCLQCQQEAGLNCSRPAQKTTAASNEPMDAMDASRTAHAELRSISQPNRPHTDATVKTSISTHVNMVCATCYSKAYMPPPLGLQ